MEHNLSLLTWPAADGGFTQALGVPAGFPAYSITNERAEAALSAAFEDAAKQALEGDASTDATDVPPGHAVAVSSRARKPGNARCSRARQALQRAGGNVTSSYLGVTHHKRTGRFEAHIWQQGKQRYLGGFEREVLAALAYDLGAVYFRGSAADTNFPLRMYATELAAAGQVQEEELMASLRAQSKSAASTSSPFRGVSRHAKGRWEARIGIPGPERRRRGDRRYKYIGLFATEVEAAMAYDREAVRQQGTAAITNFDLSTYLELLPPDEVQAYLGGAASAAMQPLGSTAAAAMGPSATWPQQPVEALPPLSPLAHSPLRAVAPQPSLARSHSNSAAHTSALVTQPAQAHPGALPSQGVVTTEGPRCPSSLSAPCMPAPWALTAQASSAGTLAPHLPATPLEACYDTSGSYVVAAAAMGANDAHAIGTVQPCTLDASSPHATTGSAMPAAAGGWVALGELCVPRGDSAQVEQERPGKDSPLTAGVGSSASVARWPHGLVPACMQQGSSLAPGGAILRTTTLESTAATAVQAAVPSPPAVAAPPASRWWSGGDGAALLLCSSPHPPAVADWLAASRRLSSPEATQLLAGGGGIGGPKGELELAQLESS